MTGVNVALVVLGFLLKPVGFSWSWGAFLALGAAIVAFLPFGVPLVQTRRGVELEPPNRREGWTVRASPLPLRGVDPRTPGGCAG